MCPTMKPNAGMVKAASPVTACTRLTAPARSGDWAAWSYNRSEAPTLNRPASQAANATVPPIRVSRGARGPASRMRYSTAGTMNATSRSQMITACSPEGWAAILARLAETESSSLVTWNSELRTRPSGPITRAAAPKWMDTARTFITNSSEVTDVQ